MKLFPSSDTKLRPPTEWVAAYRLRVSVGVRGFRVNFRGSRNRTQCLQTLNINVGNSTTFKAIHTGCVRWHQFIGWCQFEVKSTSCGRRCPCARPLRHMMKKMHYFMREYLPLCPVLTTCISPFCATGCQIKKSRGWVACIVGGLNRCAWNSSTNFTGSSGRLGWVTPPPPLAASLPPAISTKWRPGFDRIRLAVWSLLTQCSCAALQDNEEFAFQLKHKGVTPMYFKAENDASKARWVQAISHQQIERGLPLSLLLLITTS